MRMGGGLGFAIALALAATGTSSARYAPQVASVAAVPAPLADADSPAAVAVGERLYLGHCASCHGRYREGQPLWQIIDAYAGRRAPALDETGNIWRRSDEALFHMAKYGRYAPSPADSVSHMPAFKGVLDDRQVLDVIAFIKARWPIGLRIAQAMLNPGFAGMPAGASDPGWRLPPSCNAMFRDSEALRHDAADRWPNGRSASPGSADNAAVVGRRPPASR
jgi:S-disulfanyl-L-cysteine oxidoreductase SoxD